MHATPTCVPLLFLCIHYKCLVLHDRCHLQWIICISGSSCIPTVSSLILQAPLTPPPPPPPPTPSLVSIAGVCANPSDLFIHSCRGCLTEDVRQGLRVGSPDRSSSRPPWTDARGGHLIPDHSGSARKCKSLINPSNHKLLNSVSGGSIEIESINGKSSNARCLLSR